MVEGPFDSPEEAFEVVDEMNLNLIESKTLQESSHDVPKVGDIVVDWGDEELEVLAVYDTTTDEGLEELADDWGDTIEGDFMLDLDDHDYWIVAIPPGERFEMIYGFGGGGVELKENRKPMNIGESGFGQRQHDGFDVDPIMDIMDEFGWENIDALGKIFKEYWDKSNHDQANTAEFIASWMDPKSVEKKMSTTVPDAE